MDKYFKFMIIFLTTLTSLSFSSPVFNPIPIHEGFVTSTAENYTPFLIDQMPPSPLKESIPEKPFEDAIWIDGYYAWIEETKEFSWVCGIWRRPPPNHNWTSGRWVKNQESWCWQKGFWSPSNINNISYINQTPPYSITDDIPQRPQQNFFWIPGYWQFEDNTFNWLKGTWSQINENWVLTPAHYVWQNKGFVFCPMFWDWPLEKRGVAYNCLNHSVSYSDDFSPYSPIEPKTILSQLFILYPNYPTLFSHWWHINPGFWDGCFCFPPWWFWEDWWTFGWADMWGLWWWWGSLDAWPPIWIDLNISIEIIGPLEEMIIFMSQMHKPEFPIAYSHNHLRPTGKDINFIPKRPFIETSVIPSGSVTIPKTPSEYSTTNTQPDAYPSSQTKSTNDTLVPPPLPPISTTTQTPPVYNPSSQYPSSNTKPSDPIGPNYERPDRRTYTPANQYPSQREPYRPRRPQGRDYGDINLPDINIDIDFTPQKPKKPPSQGEGGTYTPGGNTYTPDTKGTYKPSGTYNPGGNKKSETFTYEDRNFNNKGNTWNSTQGRMGPTNNQSNSGKNITTNSNPKTKTTPSGIYSSGQQATSKGNQNSGKSY